MTENKITLVPLLWILAMASLFAQKPITGQVINASNGAPITGATVKVKGTSIDTVTNLEGKFSLDILAMINTLEVSFAGMQTEEIEIRNRRNCVVWMFEEGVPENSKEHIKFINTIREAKIISGDTHNGIGCKQFLNGTLYIGEWKKGLCHGKGCLFHSNGSIYKEGQWSKGDLKKEEKTVFENQFPKSIKKYGCMSGNCKNGYGEYVYENGDKLMGQWEDGFLNGQVTMISEKYKYVGSWKDGEPNGEGKIYTNDSLLYEGTWKGWDYSGFGTCYYENLGKYVGEWKNGQEHGQGTAYISHVGRYNGNFEYGKKSGQGTYTYVDGSVYEGEWKEGEKHGQGTYLYANGAKYVGEWKASEFSGKGTYYSILGDQIIGTWLNGKIQNGKYYSEGILTKVYKNGKPVKVDAYYKNTEEICALETGGYNEHLPKKSTIVLHGYQYDFVSCLTKHDRIASIELKALSHVLRYGSEAFEDFINTIIMPYGFNLKEPKSFSLEETEDFTFLNVMFEDDRIQILFNFSTDMEKGKITTSNYQDYFYSPSVSIRHKNATTQWQKENQS